MPRRRKPIDPEEFERDYQFLRNSPSLRGNAEYFIPRELRKDLDVFEISWWERKTPPQTH